MSEARAIVIDCDPGHDDAVALLLALAAPERLDVRSVTAVAGNVALDKAERNARALVELARRDDVTVYAGCERPWRRALVTAEPIVGPTGLDGADLPPPARALGQGHAIDVLADMLRKARPRSITLCPLGPLTNFGTLFSRAPELASRVREIVLMGGAIGIGNVTASAEFNIFTDPHAASCVFAAGAPIVMLPLEATHQVIATPERVRAFAQLGTPVGRAIAGLLGRDSGRDLSRFGGRGIPLHDPCVIGYLLWPELFSGFAAHVAIETESELSMGRTVVDRWRSARPPDNAMVIDRVDAEALFSRMTATLARL